MKTRRLTTRSVLFRLLIAAGFFAPVAVLASEANDWDVNAPPGTVKNIDIQVDQGTWMNVDISPDGKTLVFDLLGDLYLLPVEGGEAVPLTRGMAWDMQPRFSPDGTQIAFTSDAGGGDNIWLINRDGSNARQVTNESFRLLNNPAWSPDGRFLVARKHYTGRRSLGAGEIWLYHIAGGSGVQLNKRPNTQKDLGEPIFSADGAQVFFSRDSTPGNIFEYSKDSNDQIYEIFAIDRHSGDIQAVVSGPGGAVRPTPSPDGNKLAFVRRIRNQSSLFIKDLRSDESYPVYQQLDRDMQETWAIHGVYPNFTWTPDNRDLIFWAGGKIKRLNSQTLAVKEIPFKVKDQREIRDAVRFPVAVHPPEFDVKMLRWVTISPDGEQVVFQALGHLYTRNLPDGKPHRLTKQSKEFEYYPSYSADGRWIVFTSWNDQTQGAVKKVRARGGKAKTLTRQPGLFLEPQFSPDGETIVFRKRSGGYLTSPKYSSKAGIYQIDADGGDMSLVTKQGRQAHFGSRSDRVFVSQVASNNGQRQTNLVDMKLDGSDPQTRLNTPWGAEYRVSPDEKWIAFVERFHVFVAPYLKTGNSIASGSTAKALPTFKVSDFAGENLSWTADSQQLYWSQGDTLYQLNLPSTLTAQASLAPATSTSLGFTHPSDRPTTRWLLSGARIITMQGDRVLERGDILVEGNRITAIGDSGSIEVPNNTQSINLSGKTIIPGLVDAHWHGSQGVSEIQPQQNWVNLATLAFGVTTIHDPSNDTSTIFSASELAKSGQIIAPRIYSTGTILYGAATEFTAQVDSYDDALEHLKRMQSVGAISVKSYNQPRRDQRQQILEAARNTGLMVVPEGGSLLQHNLNMIIDGHTGIEHSIPTAEIYDDVKQLWSQTQVGYTPTLVVAYGGIWGENYWYQHDEVWKHPILKRFVPKNVLWPRSIRRTMAPEEDYNHVNNAAVAAELSRLGVGVNMGAHGQREGLGAHWEIWMFAQGGMTPLEAIRTATLNSAKYLGMAADIGSLEKGKLADLVVLDANPLDNIRNTDKVVLVMINGRLFDATTMNNKANNSTPRQPLFFE